MIVHADNHVHDGMKCVIRNLLSAAEEGRIVLFLEGNVNVPDLQATKRVKSHDIEWEGESPFIHGIEQSTVDTSHIWANAARLAFNTGRSDSRRVREAGREGVLAVRGVLVALSALRLSTGETLKLGDNVDMQTFVDRLEPHIESARRSDGWIEGHLYELADSVALDLGKWPAGDTTFKDLQMMCTDMMQLCSGLGMCGSVTECMNHQHIHLREMNMAKNIKDTLSRLEESSLITASTEIHLVIGAGHVSQLVDNEILRSLVLDKEAFWVQQEQLKGERLCDMLNCMLTPDPFSADV